MVDLPASDLHVHLSSQRPFPYATGYRRLPRDVVLLTGGVERLRLCGDGRILREGRLVATDEELVEALRAALLHARIDALGGAGT